MWLDHFGTLPGYAVIQAKGGRVISSPPGFAQDVRICISDLSKVFIFNRVYKAFRWRNAMLFIVTSRGRCAFDTCATVCIPIYIIIVATGSGASRSNYCARLDIGFVLWWEPIVSVPAPMTASDPFVGIRAFRLWGSDQSVALPQ